MTPIPEPSSDIIAQIGAVFDPRHPKAAAFVVPGNIVPDVPIDAHVVSRSEGTLVTADAGLAARFAAAADDITMAEILGYPEHKADVVRNCNGDPFLAVAVQARDARGCVITEAFASPIGLGRTVDALSAHVPNGGRLVVLAPTEAIMRRVMLRAQEGTS